MKITRQILVTCIVLIFSFLFLLHKNREVSLPTGKVTETNPINITDIVSESIHGRPQVEINTSKGPFVIELRPDLSPKSVINFLEKWANDYCTNTRFHRVEDWVVQGCDPDGTGLGGKNTLDTENSTEIFLTGSVGVARKPYPVNVSNDSQFFIVKKDSRFLDGEYTYLGKIISGMEVINMLTEKDVILTTTILTK